MSITRTIVLTERMHSWLLHCLAHAMDATDDHEDTRKLINICKSAKISNPSGYAPHPSGTVPPTLCIHCGKQVRVGKKEATGWRHFNCEHADDVPNVHLTGHPSGTEGPPWTRIRDALVKRLADEAAEYGIDEDAHVGLHRAVELLRTTGMVKLALSDVAASPPDGTAPEQGVECERCGEPVGKAPALCGECWDYDGTAPERAHGEKRLAALREEKKRQLRDYHGIRRCEACSCNINTIDLQHGVDYFTDSEDGIYLCKSCYEPATRPPDGMPGEPTDAKCYCGKPATRWCGSMNDPRKAMRCDECARSWMRSEPLAAAPPTVPGEPTKCGARDWFSPRRCDRPAGHEGEHDDSRYPVDHDWSTTHGPGAGKAGA